MKLLRLFLLIFVFGFLPHHVRATQYNPVLPTTSPYPGLTMLGNINSSFQSFLTNSAGATAPSYGVEGTLFDDSTDNYFELYTGSNWVTLGTYSSTQWAPLVNGAPLVCPASTGSANAYVVTYSPAVTALVTGSPYCFITNFSVTGSATVNINTLGAKTIKKLGGTNLASGDLGNGVVVSGYYDGTNFQLTSELSQGAGGTVTSVGTSGILTGGPITGSGTVHGASQSDSTILSNISGGSAEPSANGISAVLDYLLGTTRGSIIERGASVWQSITPGTAGKVFTSNGTGADPTYQTIGSSLTLLATVNCTSGSPCSTVTFTSTYITSTYNKYLIEFDSLSSTSGTPSLELQVSADNGSTYKTSGYKNGPSAATTYVDVLNGKGIGSTDVAAGYIEFSVPSVSGKTIFNSSGGGLSGGNGFNAVNSGLWNTAGAINNITIFFSSINEIGNFHLYGISGT